MPPLTGTPIRLAGQEHQLRYTTRALRLLQKQRGGEALSLTIAKTAAIDIEALVALIWAGLQHEQPALGLDQVADGIEPPLKYYIDTSVEALEPWISTEPESEQDEGKAGAAPGLMAS